MKIESRNQNDTEDRSSSVLERIGNNMCSVINEDLPAHSPMKKQLINIASRNNPVPNLENVIKCSRATISKYKHLNWNDIVKGNCNAAFRRETISPNEVKEIKVFL